MSALVALALALVVGVPLVSARDDEEVSKSEPVRSVSSRQLERFEALRTSAVELPAVVRDAIAYGPQQRFRVNPDLARPAGRDAAGIEMFLVPGDGVLCLASADGRASCAPDAAAEAGLLVVATATPDGRMLLRGVLPDGAHDVRVIDGAGTHAVEVSRNLYSVVLDNQQAPTVRFTDSQGRTHELPLGRVPSA